MVVGRSQGPAQAATPVFIGGRVWTSAPHASPQADPRTAGAASAPLDAEPRVILPPPATGWCAPRVLSERFACGARASPRHTRRGSAASRRRGGQWLLGVVADA